MANFFGTPPLPPPPEKEVEFKEFYTEVCNKICKLSESQQSTHHPLRPNFRTVCNESRKHMIFRLGL